MPDHKSLRTSFEVYAGLAAYVIAQDWLPEDQDPRPTVESILDIVFGPADTDADTHRLNCCGSLEGHLSTCETVTTETEARASERETPE